MYVLYLLIILILPLSSQTIISSFFLSFVMSWILIPLIFYLPFSITTPIDQFDQIDSSPSFDGSAQEGANGGLTLQPGLDYSSLVASQIDLEPIG